MREAWYFICIHVTGVQLFVTEAARMWTLRRDPYNEQSHSGLRKAGIVVFRAHGSCFEEHTHKLEQGHSVLPLTVPAQYQAAKMTRKVGSAESAESSIGIVANWFHFFSVLLFDIAYCGNLVSFFAINAQGHPVWWPARVIFL